MNTFVGMSGGASKEVCENMVRQMNKVTDLSRYRDIFSALTGIDSPAGKTTGIRNFPRIWIREQFPNAVRPRQDSQFVLCRMNKRERKCRQKTGVYVHEWSYIANSTGEAVCRFCKTPRSYANHTAYLRRQESVNMVKRKASSP